MAEFTTIGAHDPQYNFRTMHCVTLSHVCTSEACIYGGSYIVYSMAGAVKVTLACNKV